ncbi:MAG: hypothetical protein LBG20_00415 [Holosporaceae bacterium]|nr:hypothetical protein [Holosporaceae bacterium]
MAEEIDSIIKEINEEIKNDQLFAFLKKYKNEVGAAVVVIVVGILAYSSWYSRKNKQMEEVANVLLEELQTSISTNPMIIEELLRDAPSELRPILMIIKSGKNLQNSREMGASAAALLDLTLKHGVDIVWKDLALLIFVSYRLKPPRELISLLEPLTENDRPFRFTALEFIAMFYESIKEHEKARENLQKIIDSKGAPKTQKKRITMLQNFLKNSSVEKK